LSSLAVAGILGEAGDLAATHIVMHGNHGPHP